MFKTLLAVAAAAALISPAVANAATCRNAKGQFAKCGTPGAMTDAQYKAQKKPGAAPAAKPMMMMSSKPAAKPAPAAPAKSAPCKDAKGKFVKCPAGKK